MGYSFGYHDFLGEWLFNDNNSDLGAFDNNVNPEGSDYITNGVNTGVDYTFSDKVGAGIFANFVDYYFTSSASNNLEDQSSNDLNRDDATFGVRASWQPLEKLSGNAMAGVLLLHLQNQPEDQVAFIQDLS